MQGAAQTQYETAKDTASNLANKAQGHAQDAHGQAKVGPCVFKPFLSFVDQSYKPLLKHACDMVPDGWACSIIASISTVAGGHERKAWEYGRRSWK